MTNKTIAEIFENVDLSEVFDGYDFGNDKTFVTVSDELISYDEGYVTERRVVEYTPEGRYFSLDVSTNSWADEYGDFDASDIKEVFKKEKTITVYE